MPDLFPVGQGCAHEREEGVGVSGAVDDLEVPGGELVHKLFVEPDLERVFTYRAEKLDEIFQAANTPSR